MKGSDLDGGGGEKVQASIPCRMRKRKEEDRERGKGRLAGEQSLWVSEL